MRWGGRRDSNPRRPESQSGALPAELRPPSSSNSPAVARPAGIEPATAGLEGRCSIRLSYGRGDRWFHAPNVSFRSMPGNSCTPRTGTRIIANWPTLIHARARIRPVAGIMCYPCPRIGRGRGIRTPDPLLPKQMRYQTAPCPVSVPPQFICGPASYQVRNSTQLNASVCGRN
jgi:hypothetical protein